MQNRIQDKINQTFVNLSKFFLLPRIDFNQLESMIENNHSNITLASINENKIDPFYLVTLGYFPTDNTSLVSSFNHKKIIGVATFKDTTPISQQLLAKGIDTFV